jgi:O-antigen/teichoic acid export membrane protein
MINIKWLLIRAMFNNHNERSANTIKNIIASFILYGINVLISLLLVPITINYVNPTQYGIWLTLISIIGWFSLFDIGFGHGLRNRFAEARATGDYNKAKSYVSTTYICISVIFTIVWVLFFCVNFFVDWSEILNAPALVAKELSIVVLIVISFFCLQMVLKIINIVMTADQKPAKSSFFNTLGQILALIIIFILTKTTQGSLVYLALVLGFCPAFIMLVSSFWFYRHEYKPYKPSMKLFDKNSAYDIITLGSKFFITQIAAIVIYQSANIIIAQLFSPSSVVEYNIAYKCFVIPYMLLIMIITPLWSAYTDAYKKEDIKWMISVLKKIRYVFFIIVIMCTVMLLVAPIIYHFWIGDVVIIPFKLTFFIYLYMLLYMWVSMHAYLINGIGKIKLQTLFSIAEIILYIPVSYVLGKTVGIHGIVIAMIIFMAIRSIWVPLQLNKLLRKTATGIWNK